MGWCRLKIAGVEHCGLCGLAHLGHMRTCPHLNDENQVARLLQTLKESPEPRYLVEAATKHLRMIRGDLMQRKRRKMEQAQTQNSTGPYPAQQQQGPPLGTFVEHASPGQVIQRPIYPLPEVAQRSGYPLPDYGRR
jgi:chromodomain-helicase-DNA-binding protein 4